MKKYLLFAGEDYYPEGGWNDFITDSDNIYSLVSDAKTLLKPSEKYVHYDWYHILSPDRKTLLKRRRGGEANLIVEYLKY